MKPEDFLDFLEQYWELFEIPKREKKDALYTNIKI